MNTKDEVIKLVAMRLAKEQWNHIAKDNYYLELWDLLPFKDQKELAEEFIETATEIVSTVVPYTLRELMQVLYWDKHVGILDPTMGVVYDWIEEFEND